MNRRPTSRFSLAPLALSLLAAALLPGGSGCRGSSEPVPGYPQKDCRTTLWVKPPPGGASHSVALVGSWDDFTQPGREAQPSESDPSWYGLTLDLPAGEYGYLVQIDGIGGLDPREPLTTFRGEQEVSLLRVGDCHAPSIDIARAAVDGSKIVVEGTFVAAQGEGPLEPSSLSASFDEGGSLAVAQVDPETGKFRMEAPLLPRGKHGITLQARSHGGAQAKAATYAWVDPRGPWEGGLLYQVVVDRFRGDGGAKLSPPKTPGSRAGGTLSGVQAELERGYFDELGVTALWLSPVYTNPDEARLGLDGHLYDGYHGYWPLDSRSVDPRLGGEEALRSLVDAAHRRGIRVLLDIVPNHVYEKNPLWLEHRGQGWFHEQAPCVCGQPGCDWGTHIEDCWFTTYLPDFRLENPEVARLQTDDARYWVEKTGADGVRIDAVPMMPRAASRRIARALREASPPNDPYFVLGEIFTNPGLGGIDAIRYHIGPDGLDSAFDFPLMWAARDALASDRAGFAELDAIVAATDLAYQGSGEVRARILDNHDTSRFLSEAAGDDAGDTWAPAPQPQSPEAYQRLELALTLSMTLPGMPVLFHGDELGLAGKSDPDCRRVLPDLSTLSPLQAEVLARVKTLGKLRSCSAALKTGPRRTLSATDEVYVFARDRAESGAGAAGAGAGAVVMLSRAKQAVTAQAPLGSWVDVLSGESLVVTPSAPVKLAPLSARVLLPAGDPCLEP